MNYAALVTAISDYTENTFPTTDMNTFITQAEQRIYNSVQFPSTRKNVEGALIASNKYLSPPSDFLAVYSFAIVDAVSGEHIYLLNKDVSFLREAYPNATTLGTPKYYALFGMETGSNAAVSLIVAPTPDAAYPVELHYFMAPESITTAGTSWLGDNVSSVLLYGALVEAYTYMKGEADIIALYDGKYKEALMLAKRLGDGLEKQDSYRNGTYRVPVT